jgi:hypothetical protein
VKIWAENKDDVGNGINLSLFTPEVCRERQKLIAKTTRATTDSSDKSTTSEKLNTFNGKREQWMKAKRELTAYLNQIKNDNGVPLYYVIRDPNLEDQYRNDNGEIGRKIFEVPFQDRVYSKYYRFYVNGPQVALRIPLLTTITMSRKRGLNLSKTTKDMMPRMQTFRKQKKLLFRCTGRETHKILLLMIIVIGISRLTTN